MCISSKRTRESCSGIEEYFAIPQLVKKLNEVFHLQYHIPFSGCHSGTIQLLAYYHKFDENLIAFGLY